MILYCFSGRASDYMTIVRMIFIASVTMKGVKLGTVINNAAIRIATTEAALCNILDE